VEHGGALAIFLAQVLLLLAVGRLMGELMQRIGHPAVMGQLLAGVLLGPSVFGALLPDVHNALFPDSESQRRMLQALSELGVLLLLLLTGMETDLTAVRAMRRTAVTVSVSGIAIPFACGVLLGQMMPEALLPAPEARLATSLFLGTALSISSVKVVASVVRDMGYLKRRIGRVMVSAAIVDDTLAWIVIAVTSSLVMHGRVSVATVGMTLLGVGLFLLFAMTIGRRLVVWTIRWANDHLVIDTPVITAIIVLTAAFSLTTQLIGVHTVLGAFVVGLLVGQSPILTRQVESQLRGIITGLFMPIFFGTAGLSADVTALFEPRMAFFALVLIVIASVGKLAGAYIGGTLAGLTLRESTALAWGMNARGSTEIIIGTIGLSIGALTQDLYTMIVAMALFTTLIMPPGLRCALRRVPVTAEEKAQEERERAEQDQFLPGVERILAVIDNSAAGRLTARLVGRLNSTMPRLTAILDINERSGSTSGDTVPRGVKIARRVASTSAPARTEAGDKDGQPPIEPAPSDSAKEPNVSERVLRELDKGYDLVMFGLDGQPSENPGLRRILETIAPSYKGARAFVVADDRKAPRRMPSSPCILLPVTGVDYSRRAAEVAVAVAAAAEVRLTVLCVSQAAARVPWHRRRYAGAPAEERATIETIRAIAERRGVAIMPRIIAHERPDQVILREARRGGYDLIVMGVKERPAAVPSFGPTADAVVRGAPCAVLLLST
jgi:Kef-type K+ transport system membrane component KefB/nucleotide-binding universal stress UspA family protein